MRPILLLLSALLALLALPAAAQDLPVGPPVRPNLLLILADDLGSGDPAHANPASRIPTPQLDRLAREGMRFSDAHSPSAVCSPTRYGLLTGRYAWRTRLKRGVLWGNDPMLIEDDRPTLASMLQEAGYATAVVGKWHLGLGAFDPERPEAKTDFAQPLTSGPHTVGFEHSFVLPSSLDIPPYVYVVGDRPRAPADTVVPGSEQRRDGGGGFWRKGPAEAGFDHEQTLPLLAEEAEAFLRRHRAEHPEQPFFLYFPLTAPHTPWLPTAGFRGRSGAGHYGDFVAQVDAVLGRMLTVLEETGAAEETLVIFTSDNGAHWTAQDRYLHAHNANLEFRGQKADIHEGGHRVPFLARWPGRIAAGEESAALIGLNDVYATVAELLGHVPAPGEAPDSVSFLRCLLEGAPGARQELVHHSIDGMFALRAGPWKLVEGLGSGGFTGPTRMAPLPGGPTGQLYRLDRDPSERRNLWPDHPEVVARLSARLAAIRSQEGAER